MIYFIEPDDTLQRIAAKVWGVWFLWPVLRDHNTDRFRLLELNFDDLKVGEYLEIPEMLLDETTAIVTIDDTDEALSLKHYGTEAFARFIRAANNGVVIYEMIGQARIIPALVSRAEVEAARKRRAA